MSFELIPNPTFPFKVEIREPGSETCRSLPLIGKHKGRKALKAWIESAKDRDDVEFLMDVLDGWEVRRAGVAVPFNADTLGELLDEWPSAGDAIYQGYLKELTEARRKP